MEKATISKLKDNLSAYLRKVRAGHAVVIYDRDAPIARLERIESHGSGSDRLADEQARKSMLQLLQKDPQVLIGWGTPIEIASALARLERENSLTADEVSTALSNARRLFQSWHEIVPSDAVRRTAERLLRAHPLRAARDSRCSAVRTTRR